MVKRKPTVLWTPEEDEILKKGITDGRTMADILTDLPQRTKEGLRHRKEMLGLTQKSLALERLKWSSGDDDILRRGAAEKWDKETMLRELPRRSENAIYYRAKELRLGPISIKYKESRDRKVLVKRQRIERPRQWDELMADWDDRTCLACGIKFRSWGKGNRLCPTHRTMSTGMD